MKHFTKQGFIQLALSIPAVVTAVVASHGHKRLLPRQSSVDSTIFTIDGKSQYFAGTNTWWLGHLLSDADVEKAVSEIADSGLKVTRVWGFGNANQVGDQTVYYQLLDNSTQTISLNYDEANGIPRLDAAVKFAEKYGIKLVLPMLNNWDDLGGINTYCNYFGCNATTFYTNSGAQKAYQDYIKVIVNRYKSSPAIFAWELGNEPRCKGCDPSIIHKWAAETSALIKSLDSTHLVTLGDEGWFCNTGDGSYAYSCAEGVDFEANLGISTLDYGTFHVYPDQWGYTYDWVNQWISEHASLAAKYGKPIVFEEYGVKSEVSNRTEILAEWQSTTLESDIAYDSFWQFGTEFASGQNSYDSYTIYYGTELHQDAVVEHAQEMEAKSR